MANKFSKSSSAIIALIVSVIYFFTIITGNTALLGIMWIILAVLLGFLFMALGITAGIIVIKSLFVVAAELSLLIFITQSYCSIPSFSRLPQNNAAMNSLFTIAILYIGFLFIRSLWINLKESYKKVQNECNSWEKWITIVAFLLCIILFLWELYLVINPIVLNLCVYK
jgi:hypothetical protein